MASSFINAATSSNAASGTTSSLVINVPTNTADGDLMIAAIYSTNNTLTPASGWTLIDTLTGAGTATLQTWTYKRVASSEPASYTWGLSTATCAGGAHMTFRGVSGVNASAKLDTTNTNPSTKIDVTSTAASMPLWIHMAGVSSQTVDSTFTENLGNECLDMGHFRGTGTDGRQQAAAYGTDQGASGVITGCTFTNSQTPTTGVSYALALQLSVSATPTNLFFGMF